MHVENTDALMKFIQQLQRYKLSNKQKIKFQDVYAKISAHHYKRLEFKGLEGGSGKLFLKVIGKQFKRSLRELLVFNHKSLLIKR